MAPRPYRAVATRSSRPSAGPHSAVGRNNAFQFPHPFNTHTLPPLRLSPRPAQALGRQLEEEREGEYGVVLVVGDDGGDGEAGKHEDGDEGDEPARRLRVRPKLVVPVLGSRVEDKGAQEDALQRHPIWAVSQTDEALANAHEDGGDEEPADAPVQPRRAQPLAHNPHRRLPQHHLDVPHKVPHASKPYRVRGEMPKERRRRTKGETVEVGDGDKLREGDEDKAVAGAVVVEERKDVHAALQRPGEGGKGRGREEGALHSCRAAGRG